ncbi:YeeE/YedE family protein [Asticcacaulis sp. EMRT-3]|uniref:YeeE/YedE family protein n=1 Tax=Asticcacaulis sp. EMRT-3 TaxID=3040349 RepID=UPI0024AF1413|nr:YeeE/YedE family protein [Asticcacaulis sp. EMRT-3]MDI7775248.1 YeeE/YedE family protein [Asticcacaulis sp. EMRT-3]
MSTLTDTLLLALAGGALIGAAAGGLYLTTGRIAGISGIFGNAVLHKPQAWRWLFVGGLIVAGLMARLFGIAPHTLGSGPFILAVSGLLVGFGTRLGNGCTSGHGVCGLARLSPRSLVAVIVFIATAAATVFIARHIGGLS